MICISNQIRAGFSTKTAGKGACLFGVDNSCGRSNTCNFACVDGYVFTGGNFGNSSTALYFYRSRSMVYNNCTNRCAGSSRYGSGNCFTCRLGSNDRSNFCTAFDLHVTGFDRYGTDYVAVFVVGSTFDCQNFNVACYVVVLNVGIFSVDCKFSLFAVGADNNALSSVSFVGNGVDGCNTDVKARCNFNSSDIAAVPVVRVIVFKVVGGFSNCPQVDFIVGKLVNVGCGNLFAVLGYKQECVIFAIPQNLVACLCICFVKFCHVDTNVCFNRFKCVLHCGRFCCCHCKTLVKRVDDYFCFGVLALLNKSAEHGDKYCGKYRNYGNYDNQFNNRKTAFFAVFHKHFLLKCFLSFDGKATIMLQKPQTRLLCCGCKNNNFEQIALKAPHYLRICTFTLDGRQECVCISSLVRRTNKTQHYCLNFEQTTLLAKLHYCHYSASRM